LRSSQALIDATALSHTSMQDDFWPSPREDMRSCEKSAQPSRGENDASKMIRWPMSGRTGCADAPDSDEGERACGV
jgi:hypothetical protein